VTPSRLAQQRLELCEGALDRVEVLALRRQQAKAGARRLDRGVHRGGAVRRQAVHDGGIAD